MWVAYLSVLTLAGEPAAGDKAGEAGVAAGKAVAVAAGEGAAGPAGLVDKTAMGLGLGLGLGEGLA